ncbi:restriction endonuclease subunit S [Methylomonas sp. ZR1]|uniref:restriction endonuclease subunit S n=1 Tax=Methylomonas sp. ZR1 TaxID=1797072 RepID=UPI001492C21E|nr:restriction endonuclease subunit S [Methylomonas sp. ZR1]NOV29243.1 hypothetical protein [Methylomonas sp. ZR1]
MAKLSELFHIKSGFVLNLSDVDETKRTGIYPYVARTEKNNGVTAFIEFQENVNINPANTLSVSLRGSILEAFYQSKPYYTSDNMAVLTPKSPMTINEILYYAACIRSNKSKYSYGRNPDRTIKLIELPDKHEIPAWVYDTKKGQVQYQPADMSIDLSKWVDVALTDVFDIERGKSEPINEMTLEEGNTLVVSSSEQNNGVTAYTNYEPTVKSPCITLAVNGSVGACFYQDQPFIATSDVVVLKPKKPITKNVAVYLSALLRTEGKTKYSYGRKWSLENLKKTTIKLPVEDGQIDWQTIEDYMKTIENQFTIKWDVVDFKIAA